ncbi:MAG: hypothetical protein ABGZ53_36000 [Fuerstiella sp.]
MLRCTAVAGEAIADTFTSLALRDELSEPPWYRQLSNRKFQQVGTRPNE